MRASTPTISTKGKTIYPENATPGIHTLNMYGVDSYGNDIHAYQHVAVLGETESECGLVEASGIDIDSDGVDDACDPIYLVSAESQQKTEDSQAPTNVTSSNTLSDNEDGQDSQNNQSVHTSDPFATNNTLVSYIPETNSSKTLGVINDSGDEKSENLAINQGTVDDESLDAFVLMVLGGTLVTIIIVGGKLYLRNHLN